MADLRLEQEVDEQTQIAVIEEAARRATRDIWPDMPEDERKRVVESVVGFEALAFQLAIFRRGWSSGPNAQRIKLDPETAGSQDSGQSLRNRRSRFLENENRSKGTIPGRRRPSEPRGQTPSLPAALGAGKPGLNGHLRRCIRVNGVREEQVREPVSRVGSQVADGPQGNMLAPQFLRI